MEGTVFAPALEGIKHVKSEKGVMLTKPFLDACKHILPVIEKFGAAMALVKSDIGGNITRLENKYLSNPTKYTNLYSMVQEEVEAKTAKGSSSCTNGLLWLTRAMDFLVELFRNLLEHGDWAMSQACSDSYSKTLKKYHGWLVSEFKFFGSQMHTELQCRFLLDGCQSNPVNLYAAADNNVVNCSLMTYKVAMKLAPDRKKFMDVISGTGDINSDIEQFCTTFSPLLEENHKLLASVGMDELKAS